MTFEDRPKTAKLTGWGRSFWRGRTGQEKHPAGRGLPGIALRNEEGRAFKVMNGKGGMSQMHYIVHNTIPESMAEAEKRLDELSEATIREKPEASWETGA